MREHTEGEWTIPQYTRRDGYNRCWVIRGKISICRCFGKTETAEANARLIAASPDLLVACRAWMKYNSESKEENPCPDYALRFQYRKEAVKLTNYAIAKAVPLQS